MSAEPSLSASPRPAVSPSLSLSGRRRYETFTSFSRGDPPNAAEDPPDVSVHRDEGQPDDSYSESRLTQTDLDLTFEEL